MHSPEVLFLDEPTTGLDPISRSRVWDEVRRINRDHGVTVFLTTQYLEEADALADRVGIINRGVIAVEGTPTALKRSMGTDVIVASVEGDAEAARDALSPHRRSRARRGVRRRDSGPRHQRRTPHLRSGAGAG